jgi:hypothetical protein
MDIDRLDVSRAPFQCGQLLAHLDLIRRTTDGDAAIGTTCFQAAAAMPAPVLGSLLGLSWRDLSTIRRGPRRTDRDADLLEQRLASILEDIGNRLPETLDRSELGAFAAGFYQERALGRSMSDAICRTRTATVHDAVIRESTTDAASAIPDDL